MRVFLVSILLAFGVAGHSSAESAAPTTTAAPATTPESTLNEFIPDDRPVSECISAAPKPGCERRSDWHQVAVMGVLVVGLAFVGWRVVRGLRRPPSQSVEVDASDRVRR